MRRILFIALLFSSPSLAQEPYDLIVRDGRVVDGTSAPWFRADVAIRDGKIARIGDLGAASSKWILSAKDRIVVPGFIDMMGQTAAPFLRDPNAALNLLSQGITTINAGEGGSDAPLPENLAKSAGWRTMAEYFDKLEGALPMNVVQTVGHTQVRRIAIGDEDRRATADELKHMQSMVEEAMQAGAIGLSTSLIYPPAIYAPEEEIVALAEIVGRYGGRYYTHMRNEGDRLLEAIDEALRIGQKAGTPVHIFHLKAAGKGNWGKMPLAVARIQAARETGQEVGADVYPYVNNGLGIRAFLHPRHASKGHQDLMRRLEDSATRKEMRKEMEEGEGWENWFAHTGRDWDRVMLGRISDQELSRFNGQSLGAIARALEQDPWDLFFRIARTGAFAMPQTMSERNKILLMQQPFVSFDTDAGPSGGSSIASHPRAFGSFPRILARYVRELGIMSLEEAIHKMSAVAANEIMAYDRGVLAPGLAADLVVLDPETMTDRATFGEPGQLSKGIDYVVINGRLVLERGEFTGALPGRVLRGPGYGRKGD